MASTSRIIAGALLAFLTLIASLAVLPEPASAARGQRDQKVTICHRTNSRTNPYDQIAIATSAAVAGHSAHTGPIFGPDVDHWGDIIPPIRPGLPRGRNWTAEGQGLLANGCESEPDVGPLPSAAIGDAGCTGTTPAVTVTVHNDADATQPATFTIRVDGVDVQTLGPLAPGESDSVTLTAAGEDATATIEVLSGGEVIAARVVTVDCEPGPPAVDIEASSGCDGASAVGDLQVTNNGAAPVTVTLLVDGSQVGQDVVVAPGATETRSITLPDVEDRTITVSLELDGAEVASYTVTPDCVAPVPEPSARVAGTVCPPPLATVVLANTGDPDSAVVYTIRVDDKPVQRSAPLYGGDTTTIVVDLSAYEDQTVHVVAGYNTTVVVDQTVTVDCQPDSGGGGDGGDGGGGGSQGGQSTGTGALPVVGSPVPAGVVALGVLLLVAGGALTLLGLRSGRASRP
ncbi:hypothetical protein [Nocardioides mangrovi]|uniref:CARDB domain-containing protein n=1 Tax=Nocardioides mangrovi TaxID=2874580 RepID=A0ABS7UBR2_9ACTN|nr:hypothetical protein [Nocardioides mangrovi]MBZ5738269.1 hypothetical protein [Nocardioides mangrovi]